MRGELGGGDDELRLLLLLLRISSFIVIDLILDVSLSL